MKAENQMMVVMTRAASRKMNEIRAAAGKAKAGLRIEVGGGCFSPSYRFTIVEAPSPGDIQVEVEGIVICFDPADTVKLFNVAIGHEGSKNEEGFVVNERRAACCG